MAKFVVVGAGGVGGLLGGLLALAGHEVAFVARGVNLEVLRREGLVLRAGAPETERRTGPLQASEAPEALGPADCVLVALKTWQVPEVAPRLRALLRPGTLVVPLQNGVGAAAHLAAALGPAPVAGGLCHLVSRLEAPGLVQWTGTRPSVTLGALQPAQVQPLSALKQTLEAAGITALLPADFEVALWSKLLFVAPFGAVGAVAGAPVGVIRAEPGTRAQLQAAMEEIRHVALANGVRLPEDAVPASLARLDGLPEGATASLQRDLAAGRPSELEEWLGAVVRMGSRHGVPTPTCAALYAQLLPRERAARSAA